MENIKNGHFSFQLQRSTDKCSNLSQKNFSIIPDLITGWRPKALKIPPPILVKYKQNLVADIINSFKNQPQSIIYLGQRHYNSFSFHNKTQHDYSLKYCVKSQDLPLNFRNELQKYQKEDTRPFVGMNNSINSQIIFDSNFESGNLDAVFKVSEKQYDLYLRPDTNTCGHTQWFCFNVKFNPRLSNSKQKITIKFNICNNKKYKTLFSKVNSRLKQGMKPYIFSKYLNKNFGLGWHQEGKNVIYKKYNPRQHFHKQKVQENQQLEIDTIKQNNDQISKEQQKINKTQKVIQPEDYIQSDKSQKEQSYFCLSFQYQFQTIYDEVFFAYCPPYTYSTLKKDLTDLKKKASSIQNCQLIEEKLCVSLSGLDVPLLTITDTKISQEQKKIIIAVARFHPGQPNGSHVINGFLQYIISQQASELRKNITFKVIPMINPDGVVLGNFRTSLAGKDLNRQFKTKKLNLLPEISSLKSLIKKLKFQKGSNLSYFLDFHGHSIRKNTFVYGPQYDVWNIKYQKSRILPRLIAQRTPIFKLKYCHFKVANYKKSTARAFMLSMMSYCYTVESSIGIYQDLTRNNQNMNFTIQKWNQMGYCIGQVLFQSIQKLNESILSFNLKKRNKQKKQKRKQKNNLQKQIVSLKQNISSLTQITSTKSQNSQHKKDYQVERQRSLVSLQEKPKLILCDQNYYSALTANKKYLDPIRNFKKNSNSNSIQLQQFCKKIAQQDQQSDLQDKQSDTKSDCQSQSNDFSKSEYQKLNKDIQKAIQQFKKVIENVGKNRQNKNFKITNKRKTVTSNNECVKKNSYSKKKFNQQMKLVPSLMHKLKKSSNFSQKKIGGLRSLQISMTANKQKQF